MCVLWRCTWFVRVVVRVDVVLVGCFFRCVVPFFSCFPRFACLVVAGVPWLFFLRLSSGLVASFWPRIVASLVVVPFVSLAVVVWCWMVPFGSVVVAWGAEAEGCWQAPLAGFCG